MIAKKSDWVQVHYVILKPGERDPSIPPETKKVPFDMRLNGFLQEDAEIGEKVTVITLSGRKVGGKLVAVNPSFEHTFGEVIPELVAVGTELRKILS